MVTPICEEPLCGIICIFFPFSPLSLPSFATACILPPLITALQMKGVLFDSVLIIQLQSNNSTLQEHVKRKEVAVVEGMRVGGRGECSLSGF